MQPQVDREAFEAFFQQHYPGVFGYLWRMTGEEQTANDVSQETFVRAWQRYSEISAYDQPRAWLFRVATHLALNHLRHSARRRAGRHIGALGEREGDMASGDDHTEQVLSQDSISHALLSLPARERSALVLHAVYGFSCAELAKALGISLSAAKIALWRGRQRFRKAYLHEEGDS